MIDHSCSKTVWGPRVTSWNCTRKGTVERDGKWFCWQHDPIREKAEKEKLKKKYEGESREWRRKNDLRRMERDIPGLALAFLNNQTVGNRRHLREALNKWQKLRKS